MKRGRPPLPEKERRDVTIRFRCTREEEATIERAAADAGLPLVEWVRARLLEEPPGDPPATHDHLPKTR